MRIENKIIEINYILFYFGSKREKHISLIIHYLQKERILLFLKGDKYFLNLIWKVSFHMRNFIERDQEISWKMNSITRSPQREYTEFHVEKILGGLYMDKVLGKS